MTVSIMILSPASRRRFLARQRQRQEVRFTISKPEPLSDDALIDKTVIAHQGWAAAAKSSSIYQSVKWAEFRALVDVCASRRVENRLKAAIEANRVFAR